jgi:uncharacterized membrane protein (UPF0127 family)
MAGDRPFAAAPPVDELQRLVDQAVGDGRIILDPLRYVRFVVHEAFHAFQIDTMNGELPDFGLEGDERDLLPELGDSETAAGAAAEARALADGLRADDEADVVAAVESFLAQRADRRASMTEAAIALESSLEWTEGLARYADMALSEAAAGDYGPTPDWSALSVYPAPGDILDELLGWLDDLTAVPGTARDRYYEIGAAEARLLDRLMPGWHSRALPGGASLQSLLEEAVGKAEAGVTPTLRALETRTISVSGRELLVAVADRPAFWTSGLAGVETLETLNGVLFVFPDPVEAPFTNRGMAFDLDIAFFDADGRSVGSASMPACPDDPCDLFEAGAAYRYALEVPSGSLPVISAEDVLDAPADG